MVKRKSSEGQEQESGRGIPLPIQTFLWRQTSAFLRPKLGKQYEASCVSFERVLVENKLHGLSPALSEAIQSISRWELVQAALPHVLHCTATLLSNRNKLGHQDKLGVAETKLLHTLHWMLLEAPQDCCSDRFGGDRGSSWGGSSSAFIHQAENQGSPGHPRPSTTNDEEENNRRKFFQNSMATVELFVFLFAPLVHRIKESDLTFRLASGLVIWQPMWEHRQPEVSAFNALVKPIRNIVTAKRSSPTNNQSVTCESPNLDSGHTEGLQVVCETALPDSVPPKPTVSACHRGNSLEGSVSSQTSQERGTPHPRVSVVIPPCQKSRYATYFDVAVLRCLLQPHWSEEGTQWSLMYYLQRLRHMLQEKPEKPPEPEITPLPRLRSSSMVAAAPSLVNTHKTQDLTMKCNEEEKSLSTEAFSKVSLTNLRRPAVPDLSTDLGMNIFKKFKSRKEDRERERKGSIPFHHTGKKRQRRMGMPFLLHEDHLDVSPTRSTFSFGSFSGIGEDRRGIERGGWQTTILGKFTRRGSSDTATEMESLSARHSHSHHTLVSDLPDHSNSHGENTVKEVRSQISTITVATFNTTLASFNVGYADFFSEHMRKLCNQVPIPEMPHEPLACANLPRSLTDSCINYSCLEDTDHIDGTNNFVHKNGMLDLSVVLKAVYLVLNHDISSRICDVALNIVECLLQLGVVPSVEKVRRKSENKENEAPEKRPNEGSFQLKASGGSTCGFGPPPVSGAGDGGEEEGGGSGGGGSDGGGGGGGPYEKNDKNQEKDEGPSISTHRLALTMLIKIVKSLGCAYGCGEGHRGLSGDRLRHQVFRENAQNCLTKLYKLDRMQFRQTMRDYVNRDSLNNVVDFLHALLGFCMEPGLYCDIRQLVQFIKEAHGNVFRRVALSALLDSAEKLIPGKRTEETEQELKSSGSKRLVSGKKKFTFFIFFFSSDEQNQGAVLGRKDFWRKMFKSQSAASDTSSQSEQDTSECTTAHSGTTTDRRSRSRSRRISLRKKLKLPIGKWNWLKRSSLSGLADGVEDLLDISSVDRLSFIRQSSKVKFTSAVKLSEGGGPGGGLDNGRDEEENFFKRLGCHSFDDHLTSNQEGGKSKNVVNLGAIRQGMKRFQFLLNCCEPGTIPDASILAAALDLVNGFGEGQHLDCMMRLLAHSDSFNAIGVRLNELCHAESESPANLLGLIYDEETKRRLRKEDEEEDFLDDSTVNPTKCCCPFALKMAACQLLLEITTFLRETFPYMPRPRPEPLVDLESCRLRLDPEMDRHRYERKISFAGVLDENEDSKDSLHSSSHTLKSEAGFEEKKEGSPWSASEPSIEPEVLSSTGTEENYHRNMSWLHVMILLCNQQSFICTHIDYCHPHCYLHHSRSCARLVRAIKLLYGDTVDSLRENSTLSGVARGKKQKERVIDINLEGKKDSGMLKYIRHQVMSLSPAPLSLLIKAAPVLTEEMYGDIHPAAWELLLSVDEHMAGAAAAMFLLCAVKVPEAVSDMLMSEFHHPETVQRLNAILKFHTLWRFRYQVWPRMEEGAQQIFKIPPPSINFTLPSPVLGMPSVPMFDPPWVPQCSGSVQDPINEDQSKSFSARAVSRSHQRAEHILKNLQQEEEKKRLGREASLITAIPITQEACYEPTCTPSSEQEEEVEEVANLASRRLSVSPSCTSSTSHRNYSFRRGSVWSVRSAVSAEDEEHTTEHTPNHHVPQPPQAVFPACICAAVLPIVHLMEDGEVREDGVAVSAVAQQVLWNCLIEDPSTVLRHFLEKLTISNRQDELMYMLRKLLLNIGDFPAQTSHILFNYLVGLIMYFVRTPCEWGMDAISATLTFLWEVVGYVEGLFFKDLKQTMKKEQCEVKLLVTASMPGTKTLVVHGQNECDIPTQLPVHEDTQFEALLKECLEFFNIPETQSSHYFLMDKRWNLIHYNKTYVRDIYPFRRSVSPQLNLVQMHPEKGQELIQKQVFTRKLEEVGRVLFLISLTQKIPTAHKQSHVSMLQEDLLRLPSFPRNAIDAEFSLFSDPQAGKELFGLDTLQKSLWIKLLEEMFLGMPSEFPWGDEIMLFLNVFNGALILHPEDSALLRQYAATVINTAVHFNHLFSLSGYQWVLPSMLQVYADYESNPQLRQAMEFACRQFYVLHRKPFILQLFASVAPLLEFPDATNNGTSKGVSAQCLFDLLQSLEGDTPDILDILELVKAEKPLKSLDFCYGNEDLTFSISEAIKLCVTVVAYAPESFRSLQMLMVLEALVPCYLQKLKRQTSQAETVTAAREEIAAMAALATSLQALLYSVEVLTRPMTAPQMSRCDQGHKGTTAANHTMSAGVNTRYPEQGAKLHFIRENLHLLEEGQGLPREELDERIAREEFRRPRESLLNICTEFYKHCGPRLRILQNLAGEPRVTSLELLDVKSHMRLAEIAHSLLKLAPYDTQTMESRGLRRYIMEMLPITDWTAEAVRPALILILKRLDRMFNKIHKMPTLRRQVEWEPASNLIEGVCLTLQRQPIISFLPHLRSLINVCVNLVMGVVGPSSVADGLPLLHLSPYLSPPLPFSTAVVRLVALQIQALKEDFPLSHVVSPFTNQERREGMLLNLLIPFVLTVGSGSKDSPWLEQPEVLLLLQTVINILLPPRIISTSRSKNFMLESSPAHCSTPGDAGKDLRREGLAESTSQAAYLALKVILVCFERQLDSQWYWLSLQVKEMALRKVGGLALWDFLDFIVRTRIPIFVLLRPFIQCKLLAQPAENHEELTARQHIADQLERRFIPRPLCKSSLIAEFNNELKILKEAVHSGSAYQGKTSVSTMGTSTSAYRLSLATMSRSNTGTGTVWEQDSEPSQQASQDTLSRTDEEDEENDSLSMPSVVSEQEAYLMGAIGRRRFSSHLSSVSAPQAEVGMLPIIQVASVLDLMLSISNRVASVQSEPGQQNLLLQQPLGRKRGLRQLRRPLLSRQKTQTEPRSRHGARLSTTRRSIQPKPKPSAEQKRSVTFTEAQPEATPPSPAKSPASAAQQQGCSRSSPQDSSKQEAPSKPVLTSSPAVIVADLHSQTTGQSEALSAEKEKEESVESRPATAQSTPPTQLSDTEDYAGLETTSLLQHGDTVLHISEDNGMENPLLATHFSFTHVELGETDVDLDESHV
uniref:Unc-80 homolog, NALCN channel complex subunit n=1 Tax=Pavo cristatus TaxID=9049 RepID=A0A8C9LFE1_PAVCR